MSDPESSEVEKEEVSEVEKEEEESEPKPQPNNKPKKKIQSTNKTEKKSEKKKQVKKKPREVIDTKDQLEKRLSQLRIQESQIKTSIASMSSLLKTMEDQDAIVHQQSNSKGTKTTVHAKKKPMKKPSLKKKRTMQDEN